MAGLLAQLKLSPGGNLRESQEFSDDEDEEERLSQAEGSQCSGKPGSATTGRTAGSVSDSSQSRRRTLGPQDLPLEDILKRRAQAKTVNDILKDDEDFHPDSDSGSEAMESDIWTEYGGEVQEEKNDKNKVYTKWKPPKNKLTQEISRKKSIAKPKAGKAGKAVAIDTTRRASKMMDSAMMSVSAGPGKSSSQIYFYDWSDNYRRVLKEIKMQRQMTLSSLGSRAGSEVSRSPSRASKSSEDSGHASHRSSQFRGVTRKLGAARPVLTKADGSSLTPTSKDISRTTSLGSIDGRKNSRKGSSSTVKDLVDTRWPKTMWDNMSGFWRMQCSGDSFRITPAHYSLYLDPVERERTLSISWKTYMDAKEKCLKWLSDYQDHFSV